jgi:hypothetical protein
LARREKHGTNGDHKRASKATPGVEGNRIPHKTKPLRPPESPQNNRKQSKIDLCRCRHLLHSLSYLFGLAITSTTSPTILVILIVLQVLLVFVLVPLVLVLVLLFPIPPTFLRRDAVDGRNRAPPYLSHMSKVRGEWDGRDAREMRVR